MGTHQQDQYLLRQPLHARWRDPQTTLAMRRDTEAEDLAFPEPRHRVFLRIGRISLSARTSLTCLATRAISTSWLTRSKNFCRSMSTIQPLPARM